MRILPLQVEFIFSSHILILANYNRLFFPSILMNALYKKKVSFLQCLNIPKSNLVYKGYYFLYLQKRQFKDVLQAEKEELRV